MRFFGLGGSASGGSNYTDKDILDPSEGQQIVVSVEEVIQAVNRDVLARAEEYEPKPSWMSILSGRIQSIFSKNSKAAGPSPSISSISSKVKSALVPHYGYDKTPSSEVSGVAVENCCAGNSKKF